MTWIDNDDVQTPVAPTTATPMPLFAADEDRYIQRASWMFEEGEWTSYHDRFFRKLFREIALDAQRLFLETEEPLRAAIAANGQNTGE